MNQMLVSGYNRQAGVAGNKRMKNSFIVPLVVAFAITGARASQMPQQEELYRARDQVLPALVHIQPVVKDYNTGELKKQEVVGSGVIFDDQGHVVTNYHVAGKAERIICTLSDRQQVTAQYVGGDPPTDIAVIKLNLEGYKGKLHVAKFGDSDSLQVGQYVMAMGSPLSLSRTVSAGVISTKDRYFSEDVRLPSGEQTGNYNLWIQTDAAINPGNSGGPLVDMNGEVIGINSRATLFANNIGFAIPVNIVKEVTRSWIGIHCQALQELENYFGATGTNGVLIASIDPGSPAEASFLRAGDLILEMDGKPVSARFVEELPAFYKRIASRKPGSLINFKVKRGDQEYNVAVTTKSLGDLQGEDFECPDWGFTVKGITRQMRIENQLKDTIGVFVVGVKRAGVADAGGLRSGDVIVSANREAVVTLPEFVKLYTDLVQQKTDRILFSVKRGGSSRLVLVKAEKKEAESDE
jgi:serine protease Do